MKYKILISKLKIEELIKKLPVSYYLGNKLEVAVGDSDTSYIDLLEHKIYICPNNFSNIELDHEPSEDEIENLVRCALYHEVSHAMLTPLILIKQENEVIDKDLINVMEDERIETILRKYYKRTNFKKFVFLANNYKPETMPNSGKEMFYQIVRFREFNNEIHKWLVKTLSEGKLNSYASGYLIKFYKIFYDHCYSQKEISEVDIKKLFNDYINLYLFNTYATYNFINAFNYNNNMINNYKIGINGFYNCINSIFEQYKEEKNKKEKQEEKEKQGKIKIAVAGGSNKQEEKQEEKEKIIVLNGNELNEDNEEFEEENRIEELEYNNEEFDNYAEEDIDDDYGLTGDGLSIGEPRQIEEVICLLTNKLLTRDVKFYNECNKIIRSYKTNNKLNGNIGTAYSGRLNARLYVRDNEQTFRWFEHKNGNSIKRGSKLLLNIFCDTSGSFANNDGTVNRMLTELERIEKENPKLFEFNLISVNDEMLIMPKNHRRIHSSGGTNLNMEWKKIINKTQDADKDIINIALFDGKIYFDNNKPLLSVFNKNNMVIISDYSNRQGFKQYCKQAKKLVFVDKYESYTRNLKDNILKAINSYIQGL